MNYSAIKKCDIANGPGVRVSLFVSGCTHHCPGCFNPGTWDFDAGEPFGEKEQRDIFAALAADYAEGLTLLGGEPFEPENQRALLPFVREAKRLFPSKSVWAYTGYVYDRDIAPPGGRAHCEVTDELLSFVDVLVDGPFVESLKNISLRFRGSSNQRFLELHAPGGVKDATERYSPSDGRRA